MLLDAMNSVDAKVLESIYDQLFGFAYPENDDDPYGAPTPVYVLGNGGSAAIASHFCADFNKNIWQDTDFNMRAICLNDNMPTFSAIANDSHYAYVFSQQLAMIKPNKGDIAIAISSSGNSANIINGLAAANKHSMKTIALVGFNGGSVKENNLADTILHVNSNNYGVVEDTHMIILHALIKKLRKDRSAVSNPKL